MRRKQVFGLVLVCFCCHAIGDEPVLVSSQMVATSALLIAAANTDDLAYEIVESLTTEVGPRLAGSESEARARTWAIAKLDALGFSNVRVEPFEVPLWTRGVETAAITEPFPQALHIATLGGSAGTGTGGVEAEVVAFESLAALQGADREQVQGRIVFIDESMARSRDGSGYGEAVAKRRETAYVAQDLGALAALIRSVGTSHHRFAHTGQMRSGEAAGEGVPAAALSAPDADQLRRALGYGQPVRVKLVITPELQPAAVSGNVIAEIPGREAPEEIVLVGAHLDSWDLGTGAVDDGAGVGIVIAAAKLLLTQLPEAPRRTIRVVLFGAEEVGLVGARAYADQHAGELQQHAVATESDFGAGDIWQFDTQFGPGREAEAAAIAARLQSLGIAPGEREAYGGPDITFLRAAGVPVVTLQQDGTDYFDLHHTANDTLDKITPAALRQNVAAYAVFMYLAAEMSTEFR